MSIRRVKGNMSINNFKNVNLSFLQGIRVNIFKFFNEAAISLRHLGKSILEDNLTFTSLSSRLLLSPA